MNKKRIAIIAFALVLLLVLASCGTNSAEVPVVPTTNATEPSQTTEATEPTTAPTEPQWEPGVLRATYAEGVVDVLDIGTEVEVVGQVADYYVISGEEYDLLVEKRFIRLNSADTFESWTAYARKDAEVFSSVYMREEPIAKLRTNTVLTVLEGNGDWIYVQWDDGEGYMLNERVSKNRIRSGSNSGSGGTGGSQGSQNDGTDVDVGALSYNQGQGGIVLLGAYYGPEQEAGFETGKGIVIADKVEEYLVISNRNDAVKVTASDEAHCTIWLEEELYVELPRWLVHLEGDEMYESWNGYSSSRAVVYKEYQLRNEVKKLNRNTVVVVLDMIPENQYSYYHPGCYVVEIDGEVYYMALETVRATKFAAPSNNGGSGNGGSGDVWTPPAL